MRNSTNSARKSMSPISKSELPFFHNNVKDQSPFSGSSKTPAQRKMSPASQWDGQSPPSLLEESFGGINMNGGSPMNFGQKNLPLGMNFSQSPPQNNLKPDSLQHHVLTVHPTSLKSRVETQIPIRLTLFPLPMGVKKVRLPSHTISKPKFLAPPDADSSPDTLELRTSLVCTSAMQDQHKLQRAFAKARGETGSKFSGPVDDLHEEDTPLGGGEVKICAGCIQRERKRASRKKQRKPEEDELFQKDEEKRVIVFNTNELKEWTEASKNNTPSYSDVPPPSIPAGAMQVELPMRIACYCRHQNEKLGFQAIFTLKDWVGNVIAQAITNSIMITDDHKTHAPPASSAPGLSSALAD
ncbi:SPT3 Dosage dependent suppressor of Ty-induced promoter mutations-like protein, partial [Elasticomyces elasticus]